MRLAELITINLGDFKDDTIKITGKGNKERLVYLNTACQAALEHYLPARAALNNLRDKEALLYPKDWQTLNSAPCGADCCQLPEISGLGQYGLFAA